MLKRLSYNLSRVLRTNMGTFDNDAKSCYDRIINGLAMLAARRLGMPTTTIATHAGVLSQMKYTVKTTFGISDAFIASSGSSVLYGTGQGSGASLAIWLTLSTILLSSLQALTIRGMVFQNPSGSIQAERHSDSFVDDTQNGINDAFLPTPWTLPELHSNLSHMSHSWERLLYSSGGALEPSKCFYYLIYWTWKNGLPAMLRKSEMAYLPPIKMRSGNQSMGYSVNHKDITEPHLTLGVHLTPTGDESAQTQYLSVTSNRISTLVLTSNLTRDEALLAYRYHWTPAICYSLGVTTMNRKQLTSIQTWGTGTFLRKMGYNRNFPRAVAFAPESMGGTGPASPPHGTRPQSDSLSL
jgi:hypothetical protein